MVTFARFRTKGDCAADNGYASKVPPESSPMATSRDVVLRSCQLCGARSCLLGVVLFAAILLSVLPNPATSSFGASSRDVVLSAASPC